jgi:putative Mg2+ transporter-C (MgtC) family protein
MRWHSKRLDTFTTRCRRGKETMNNFAETAWHLLQLAVAFVLALPIAWDREQKERSAGLRTFTLVAISSCGFLIAARSSIGPSADAESRVWQGLLTGIGFIGSGAILKTEGSVRGTATAASLWNTAAVGAAVAYSNYDIAIALSVANFVVLRWLAPFKAKSEEHAPRERPQPGDS